MRRDEFGAGLPISSKKRVRCVPYIYFDGGLFGDRQAAGHLLDELPGYAAGAGASGDRPFDGFGVEFLGADRQADIGGIAVDHGQEGWLVAVVEAEP